MYILIGLNYIVSTEVSEAGLVKWWKPAVNLLCELQNILLGLI